MNAEYTTIVSEIMHDYLKFAEKLEIYGINVHVLSVSDNKGIKELLMADMLLFTLRIIGEDDPITDEHSRYINACIGYDFTPSELAEVRTEVFKKTNTYICALLPYMILFDKNMGTISFTKMYIICLMYLAIGYISIKESAGTGETVRYYKYTMKAKELAEKVIGTNVEIDPIEKVSADPKSKLLIKLLAECGDDNQDEVITDLEKRVTAIENGSIKKDIRINEHNDNARTITEPIRYLCSFEVIVDKGDGSDLADNISEESRDIDDIKGAIEELDSLIGLEGIKDQIKTMMNVHSLWKAQNNGKKIPLTMHMAFIGNPGTGKTTAARLIGKIYKEYGLLSRGHLVEVSRADLVGKYVGHTAAKVKEIFEKAKGGVLFIDEAYTLSNDAEGGYGQEAIDMIVKLMEDYREDIVVIFAGYPKSMHTFLESNPGLSSRIPNTIRFDDYTAEELFRIFLYMCEEYDIICTEMTASRLKEHFKAEVARKDKGYGNGRAVRNYFEKMFTMMSNRMAEAGEMNGKLQFLPIDMPQEQVLRPSYLQCLK